MNERMLELVEESRDQVPTQTKVAGHVYVPGPMVRGDVNLQRFAELIVRECAEVAANVVAEHEGVDFGLVEKCYKHFGVEQ